MGWVVSALRGGTRCVPAPSTLVPAARPSAIPLPAQSHPGFYVRATAEHLCLWSLDTCAQIFLLIRLCGWVF